MLGTGGVVALALFRRGERGELVSRGDRSVADALFWRAGVAGGVGSPEDESDVAVRRGVAGGEGCERRADAGGVEETVG